MTHDAFLKDPFHAPVPPLKRAGLLRRWLVSREAKHLPQHLAPGESLRAQVPVWYTGRPWLLAITPRRLLLLRYPLVGAPVERVIHRGELQSCGFRSGWIAQLRVRMYRGPDYVVHVPDADLIPLWAAVVRARAE